MNSKGFPDLCMIGELSWKSFTSILWDVIHSEYEQLLDYYVDLSVHISMEYNLHRHWYKTFPLQIEQNEKNSVISVCYFICCFPGDF